MSPAAMRLLRRAASTPLRVVSVHVSAAASEVLLELPIEDVEEGTISVMYALSLLAFGEQGKRWPPDAMVERLTYVGGRLRFDASLPGKGGMEIEAFPDGEIRVQARGAAASSLDDFDDGLEQVLLSLL